MRVTTHSGEDTRAIREYLSTSPSGTLYHDIRWLEVIRESFGHRTFYLVSEETEGRVTGILPLVHMKSIIFGNFLVSMPFFNYGGISAGDEESKSLLLEESIRIAERVGAEYIEFRQTEPIDGNMPVKTGKVSMRLSLPGTVDDLWKSFPSKLRSQVRRPEKAGMIVKVGREEELEGFYRVFSINMRALGTPVYPINFFRNILEKFPEKIWICTVYRLNKPVASGFLAGFMDTLEIPWASSIRRYNRMSPNMLLYWGSLSYAIERGYKIFDFGRSTPGEGTYRFKAQWGAKPVQLYWNYWLKDNGELPDVTPGNPKYKFAIEAWKKMPLKITRFLGPRIVKFIP
jgi:FemAB-related protein (PEP-CTERM system-associated)